MSSKIKEFFIIKRGVSDLEDRFYSWNRNVVYSIDGEDDNVYHLVQIRLFINYRGREKEKEIKEKKKKEKILRGC